MSRSRRSPKWRDPGGDHLVNICDCHDCRKRRKIYRPYLVTRAERRENDRYRENTM